MENGKQSFDQRSDNTKTIEDRDYFVHGRNIFNRSNYVFLLKQTGLSDAIIEQRTRFTSKVDPYWIDQVRDGWKQYRICITRNREVAGIEEFKNLLLFYNSSSPYAWWFEGKEKLIVMTLGKNEEKAIEHANKVLTQQYLNPKWLAIKEHDRLNFAPY